MKPLKYAFILVLVLGLTVPAAGEVPDDTPDFGTLYGDLYVILRDEDGVPILTDYTITDDEGNVYEGACVQPISALDGEPFDLATYIDEDGDVVECELTEEMLAWVQAVDFGRLNLGRAPYSVIAHAFDEAINKMNAATAIGIDPAGRLVMDPGMDSEKTVDSPAENLALYIKMMLDGHWITLDTTAIVKDKRPPEVGPPADDGPSTEERPELECWMDEDHTEPSVLQDKLAALGYGGLCDDNNRTSGEQLTSDELLLAASLLAAAADKTGTITLDKVVYINSVYGINQEGSIVPDEGVNYFDFGAFAYNRAATFGNRTSGDCATAMGELGWIWVLQPELDDNNELVSDHYVTTCMEILGHESDPESNAVHFVNQVEAYTTVDLEYDFADNVRGFVQASDDALQVLEYIHNYKVPEDLYPDD